MIFKNKLFSFFSETRVEDPDPHYFGKQDPDRDPNPAFEYKSGSGFGSTLKSKFMSFRGSKKSHRGAVDAHNGGVEAQNGAVDDT